METISTSMLMPTLLTGLMLGLVSGAVGAFTHRRLLRTKPGGASLAVGMTVGALCGLLLGASASLHGSIQTGGAVGISAATGVLITWAATWDFLQDHGDEEE